MEHYSATKKNEIIAFAAKYMDLETFITSWEIDGETVEAVLDFVFWGLQNHCRW